MKYLLYTIVSLIMLISCSMDETKEVVPDKEIEFVVSTTKATEININNFESFQVKAVYKDSEQIREEFTDIYSRNDEDLYYTSENKHVWPETGMLEFYAYYPYDERYEGITNVEMDMNAEGELIVKNFRVPVWFSDHIDFVSATAEGSKYENDAVSLDFQHNLAQIEIRGKNTSAGYKCSVYAVIIYGMSSVGDFNFSAQSSNEKWVIVEDENDDKVCATIFNEPIELGTTSVSLMGMTKDSNGMEMSDNAMLIPQTLIPWDTDDADNSKDGAFIALLAKITTVTDTKIYPIVPNWAIFSEESILDDKYEEYDLIAIPIADTWEAGTKYIYTWDIPKVGGYVYPGKPYPSHGLHDVFCSGDPIMGNRIKALTPTVRAWDEDVRE